MRQSKPTPPKTESETVEIPLTVETQFWYIPKKVVMWNNLSIGDGPFSQLPVKFDRAIFGIGYCPVFDNLPDLLREYPDTDYSTVQSLTPEAFRRIKEGK